MKTAEELNEIKKEVDSVKEKLKALSEEELKQVIGGCNSDIDSTSGFYMIKVVQ